MKQNSPDTLIIAQLKTASEYKGVYANRNVLIVGLTALLGLTQKAISQLTVTRARQFLTKHQNTKIGKVLLKLVNNFAANLGADDLLFQSRKGHKQPLRRETLTRIVQVTAKNSYAYIKSLAQKLKQTVESVVDAVEEVIQPQPVPVPVYVETGSLHSKRRRQLQQMYKLYGWGEPEEGWDVAVENYDWDGAYDD